MRWQLAYPGAPIPLIGELLGAGRTRRAASCCPSSTTSSAPCTARSWCSSASCRSPSAASATSSMPLQIGAPDMAFPKLNMMSYWVYFVGGVRHARQLLPARRRRAVRLDVVSAALGHRHPGQTMWLVGMIFLITSSLLGSINFIVTIVQLRAKGLTLHAPAVLRLGAARHRVPAAARVPAARSGGRAAADGSRWPARASSCRAVWWSAAQPLRDRRRRQPAALAAPVLVPRAPRGLRADPARRWASSPRSSPTTRASRCGATARWSTR